MDVEDEANVGGARVETPKPKPMDATGRELGNGTVMPTGWRICTSMTSVLSGTAERGESVLESCGSGRLIQYRNQMPGIAIKSGHCSFSAFFSYHLATPQA